VTIRTAERKKSAGMSGERSGRMAAMIRKDRVQRARSGLASVLLVLIGSVALMGEACHTAHQKDTGIKGGGSGCKDGPFKRKAKFAPDAPAPASGAFEVLLGGIGPSPSHLPDPNLMLRWGSGGDASSEKDC
jgi:hypothetical protein